MCAENIEEAAFTLANFGIHTKIVPICSYM